MVDYPFAGGPAQQGPPDPDILSQIAAISGDPALGGAIANIGLQMASGGQWGDTGMSRITRALASGGQSLKESELRAQKEREAASKADLREAQATAAEARAGRAGAGAETKAAQLGIQEGRLELARQALDFKRLMGQQEFDRKLVNDYYKYVDQTTKSNLIATTPQPLLSPEEWKAKGTLGGGSAAPNAAPSPALDLPKDKSQLKAGQQYKTSRGVATWDGTEFK